MKEIFSNKEMAGCAFKTVSDNFGLNVEDIECKFGEKRLFYKFL